MAIQERLLRQLTAIGDNLRPAADAGEKGASQELLKQLTEARDLCRKGLPESDCVAYGEIYDGMVLAVEQMVKSGQGTLQEEVRSLLAEILRGLLEKTRTEQHFKKEVVFLPYKASMWDSLESVWKAAHEDTEHCNAYVIPIPYADRNPDGSVAEWHCEREEFPKYVPTLDWQNIDLKAMHPDVIFIHNPYDEKNFVTSVEQRFYSGNLRECTDRLVYIPYFVLGEIDPGNESAVENIQHFIMTPGVMNSDVVIVQSEKMREAYIEVLSKNTNVNDRTFWERRILGLGSPKFDKVEDSKREDYELPEEWKKIIRGRKAILYNTGLGAMLEHTDEYCNKICSVLDTFRKRDDVVLWWRPHPLLRATLQSMRPDVLKRYEEIVFQYREENWGIFDDPAELERAVAWTDGYYGDWSSVVQLYEKVGKPIMIQDVEVDNKE